MELRSVALTLAGRWPVFPLLPGTKRPATREGLDAATQNPDRIAAWWERLPAANVGLRTGSGLVVVDLDPTDAESGYANLSAYAHSIDQGPEWLGTFTVATPRRGMHLYFSTERDLGNRTAMLPGVDARGQRGYVVAPYSRVRSEEFGDRRYLPESRYREVVGVNDRATEVLEEFEPEIAPIPAWLEDLILRPKPASEVRVLPDSEIRSVDAYITAVLIGERHRMQLARPGARNHALNVSAYRLGRHVAAGRLEFEEAESWLIGTAHHYLPGDEGDRGPLTVQEILATVRSGLEAGSRDG